jgi:nitroreductase
MTETHDVARAMIERRSWRILMDTPIPRDDLDAIQRLADLAPSVNGGRAARVVLVHGEDEAGAMTRAITGGLIGKSNLWLRSCRPPAYAVLIGDAERGVQHGPHHLYNVDVAIAGQLVCLAAAARNLGSCWMAAIDMGGVAKHMGLGKHERTPAVIALGAPGLRRKGAMLATAWDRITRKGVSSRRKPVEKICFLGRYESGDCLPEAELADLPADGRTLEQATAAIAPSATFAGEDPGDAKLALLMEAMRQAPSADNAQTWRFVVVRGQAATAELLSTAGHAIDPTAAPAVLIATFAAPFIVKKVHSEQPFALIDHPIALSQALLAAEALGLHYNATFAFDGAAVRDHLGVPDNVPPTMLLWRDAGGEKAGTDAPPWVQLRR